MNTDYLPASEAPTESPPADAPRRVQTPASPIARPGRARMLAAGATLALLFAACSGASPSTNGVASLPSASAGAAVQASATPTPNASDQYAQILAYSQCMRAHGITDFPDPQAGAGGGYGLQIRVHPGSDLDPNSPKFQAAQTTCQSLMPAPKPGQAGNQEANKQQALAFSQCMRAHGVTNFPDPQFNSNGGVTLGGGPNSGIDPNSPTFQAAQQACQSLLRGANSGTSTNNGAGSSTPGGSSQP
jgi:hypothetical protein